MTGAFFSLAYLFSPKHGMLPLFLLRKQQRFQFALKILATHILHHEGLPEQDRESRLRTLHEHLRWNPSFTSRVVKRGLRQSLMRIHEERLLLTEQGRQLARQSVVQ